MHKILFRADANQLIGTGDLMSLVQLSFYFQDAGWKCYFLVKEHAPAIRLMDLYGVTDVIYLPEMESLDYEIHTINRIVAEKQIDLVFFEITANKLSDYEGLTADVKTACVCFDGQVLQDMDLVVDWDVTAHETFDPSLYPNTRFLLGPEYVILPFDFDYDRIRERKNSAKIRKMLVCMGGADDLDYTGQLVSSLSHRGLDIELTLVTGPGYEYIDQLKKTVKSSDLACIIKHGVRSMFHEYMACDLAIGAGGLVASELVATRTRSLLIATYEHQVPRCNYFHQKGWATYLGFRSFNSEKIFSYINRHGTNVMPMPFEPWAIVEAARTII